jgi:hypothetical protein
MRVGFKQCASFPSESDYFFWIGSQQAYGARDTLADRPIAPLEDFAETKVHLSPREEQPANEDEALNKALVGKLNLVVSFISKQQFGLPLLFFFFPSSTAHTKTV